MTLTVIEDREADLAAGESERRSSAELNDFLRDVEARAYRITLAATRDPEDALDIVQDAMIRLVRRYAGRPSAEWAPLFYRILKNRTRDWHRRQAVRRRVFSLFTSPRESRSDPIDTAPAARSEEPSEQLRNQRAMRALEAALRELPERQREAFELRNFEGLDVEQTAMAMGCTAGSVKTHYSRAVRRLRERLGEHWG
jgi:RNA polymerase sigma-70 factor (ECF subfamily)